MKLDTAMKLALDACNSPLGRNRPLKIAICNGDELPSYLDLRSAFNKHRVLWDGRHHFSWKDTSISIRNSELYDWHGARGDVIIDLTGRLLKKYPIAIQSYLSLNLSPRQYIGPIIPALLGNS
jgi:hypothetical protein